MLYRAPRITDDIRLHSFRLLEAIKAGGHVQVLLRIPNTLESVRILDRASSVNTETISAMVDDLGADNLTPLLNIVIRYGPFAVSSLADVER